MKKLLCVILMSLSALFLFGCSQKDNSDTKTNMTPQEIIDTIYEQSKFIDEGIELETKVITAENEEYFFGVTGLDYKEAVASEPMISTFPFSVCVLKMNEGADVEAAAAAIRENANPAKWICVQVDPSNVVVDTWGDIIILIMSDEYASSLHSAFVTLKNS